MPRKHTLETQDPDRVNMLLDRIIVMENLKNDAALGRFIGLPAPIVSKMRHGRIGLSGDHTIKIHLATDMPVREILAAVNSVN